MIVSRSASRHLMRRLAPALLLATASVCGPLRRNAGPPPTQLVFTNDALTQADVFIIAQGVGSRRIGTVFPGQTDTLVVPLDIATRGGTVNVVARLLAGSSVSSGPVSILPGERYEVGLSNNSRLLSFLPARS
jgi:hypothetical protein